MGAGPWETKHKSIKELFEQVSRKGTDLRLELMEKAFVMEFFAMKVRHMTASIARAC